KEYCGFFLHKNGKSTDEIENHEWIASLPFLTDLVGKLNDLNVRLQGKNTYISQIKFQIQFETIEKLEIWFSVFDTPFSIYFHDIQDAALQMELIALRCGRRIREKFMNSSSTELIELYRTLPNSQFPNLKRNAPKTIAMFENTYFCEQAFLL
ncbi:hypothetical protein C0J52_19545, partial [Blattella germanica]